MFFLKSEKNEKYVFSNTGPLYTPYKARGPSSAIFITSCSSLNEYQVFIIKIVIVCHKSLNATPLTVYLLYVSVVQSPNTGLSN